MAKILIHEVVKVMVDIVREALVQGEEVQIEGLGTFRVDHCPSEAREQHDGHVVMKPPRDEIIFVPDATPVDTS